MRKENKGKSNNALQTARIQSYHEGGWNAYSNEAYAFMGYEENLYFTSDRTMKLDAAFNRADGKALKGYGLEVETGLIHSMDRNVLANIFKMVIFKLFPAKLFKMQSDSTISGIECITQVMTKEAIRNNYAAFKSMFNEYFPAFGITCDDGKCGMHVNLSVGLFGTSEKAREEAVRKLYYIINRHYDLFTIAFYRKPNHTTWCGRMDSSVAKTMDIHRMNSSHENCFNGSHYDAGRVEIRLVGGQKNYACFRNTMETIFHLVERVKTISWADCNDVAKIFSGCNKYVFDRLKDNCFNAGVISSATIEAIRPTVDTETAYL